MKRMRDVLAGVPRTAQPDDDDDNVVHMPRPTLDDLERAVAIAQNEVVAQGIECDRAMLAYKKKLKALDEARSRMSERLKESGWLGEFVTRFPEVDDAG